MKATQKIEPRVFDDKGAAKYDGFSQSWHKSTRYEDRKRIARSEEPIGPKWVKIGRNIRYFREDLDEWLNALHERSHPAWQSDFQSNTIGLKNSGKVA